MEVWILAIVVTAIACAALYYAAARGAVNAAPDVAGDATTAHFRLQLKEIESDIAAGRLSEAEAQAVRGEIAREVMRLQGEAAQRGSGSSGRQRQVLVPAIVLTAVLALGTYAWLGSPGLPSQPLANRAAVGPQVTLGEAVARIEARLAEDPDDSRGWSVIAPAYMQFGRFADAERAFRRVIELNGPTADAETNLGEAIMMGNGGSIDGEPLSLFRSAAARDPRHVRSRYYLAEDAMRTGDYAAAVAAWNELLSLAGGDEAWVGAARNGLEAATAGLAGEPAGGDDPAIAGMVEGLSARLEEQGGSIEEWTRLVRSRLVLGQTELAQASYDAARNAYPNPSVRTELDVLAADNGLVATGATN